jgi:hypothetical protein
MSASTFFYNIVNTNTPNYLCTLIPPTIQSTSVYPLRNGNDIILPFCWLSSTSDSFIPSTIKMWNSLNNTIRNVNTLSKFKSELKKIDAVPKLIYMVLGNSILFSLSFVFELWSISSCNCIWPILSMWCCPW